MAAITTDLLKTIIADQQEEQIVPAHYFQRDKEEKLTELAKNKEIIILTGMRRCGKSVLLHYVRNHAAEKDYYFNFEDERLVTFTSDDFQTLYEVFIELFGEQDIFYFDEIQNIPHWEMFVRRLYNSGKKIFLTGSNATLFSDELGTRLTGRYVSQSIYPFSFHEYARHEIPEIDKKTPLSTKIIGHLRKIFNNYCEWGGIPEYLNHHQTEYLHSLYNSILYRDIVVRYKISNVDALKKLVFYLASNCSKEITYTSLRNMLGLGSATTISDYCSYLENSYLCFLLNRYSASVKIQQQSPKKIYFVDHALAKIIGFRFSDDKGRMLENIVLIELRRRGHNVFYHRNDKECDFIIQQGAHITTAIQVCYDMADPATRSREFAGLLEAMETYSLKSGYILTDADEAEEKINYNNLDYHIYVLPIWKWLLDN